MSKKKTKSKQPECPIFVGDKQPSNPKNPHYFLGEDLLVPGVDKVDGGRLNMFISHTAQMLTLTEGELPRVFTRFENQIGKYSQGIGYRSLKENATLLAEVGMGESERYLFLAFDDGTADVVTFRSSTRLTEDYGHVNHYCLPEEIEPGTELEAGTLICRSDMFDDDLNLRYGTNLRAVFLAKDGLTFEDGIILTESGAKKFQHTSVTEAVVSINNNDVLINLYGDRNSYKPFPNVGETIENGVLCCRRRIDYATVLTDFKENAFEIDHVKDTVFYFDGKIEAVEVFTNLSDEELAKPHNAAVKAIVENRRGLFRDIVEVIEEIKKEGYKLRDDCGYLLQKARDYVSGKPFTYDRSEFEGTILKFTIRKDHPVYVGSKLTGRYGNKGTVSRILSDKEAPRTADGRIPDVILNPLGVLGRLNPAQLFEHELVYCADEIVRKVGTEDPEALCDALMHFLEIVAPDQHKFLSEYLTDEESKTAFATEAAESGLLIHQPPFFGNASFETMRRVYEEFEIEKTKFEGIQEPLVFGSMYFIQLKHEPSGKMSVRSGGQVGLLDVPFKSNEQYKKGTLPFNNSPVRFGEQEFFNFLLLANQDGGAKEVMEFLRCYSSHNRDRKQMLTKLLRHDPERVNFDVVDGQESVTSAAQVIRSFFAGMGIILDSSDLQEVEEMLEEDDE